MHLSRRELLTSFLGAVFAAQACNKPERTRLPDGEIVGQDVTLGHVLRENRRFDVPADQWQDLGIAIIGGGIAGLSAAWKLKGQGFNDFAVFELEKETGGTSRSGVGEPVNYPWGAHYLPVPFAENTELVKLLDEMGLTGGRTAEGDIMVKEQFLCRDPAERIFYRGRWYDGLYLTAGASEDDKRQLAEFERQIDHWVNWRGSDGKRAFSVPIANCSIDPRVTELDKISFADWLGRSGFTSERLAWYCDYATRDDYGLRAHQTSAWAGLFYFCSRVRKSGAESQPFITFPEGNGRFVEHFRGKVGENVRTSQIVVSVVPTESGVEVICLREGQLHGFRCKKAIFAAPVFTAPYLIRGFREDPPFDAVGFHNNAWFVANLFLKGRPARRFPKDFPLSWDNVFYESPSLGYVVATHQRGIDYGPTILTYYYPMCEDPNGRTTLFNYDHRQLADVCLTDVARAHPDIYELAERIDIMRWGHAMISPRPGFIWGGEREKAVKPYGNIHVAHTDLSGIALFEEAFHHGLRAAAEVASDTSFDRSHHPRSQYS